MSLVQGLEVFYDNLCAIKLKMHKCRLVKKITI